MPSSLGVPQVEVKDDEEQNKKFDETVQLLLAAGYFRARIKGLSPFDKVVGGMVWCITTCDFDVDVDLLFQENSTIGQKIYITEFDRPMHRKDFHHENNALTEKIVAVLPKMKCPHRIEPHQIQGLDFIHIYPVIQWLVKRAIETREEMGDTIRGYSLTQFHRHHKMPQDDELEQKLGKCFDSIHTVKKAYKVKRIYRKPDSFQADDEETRVHSTLLEYGRRYGMSRAGKSEKDDSMQKKALKTGLVKESGQQEVDEDYINEERKIKSLLEGMSGASLKESLSSHTVGSIVGLQSEEISQMATEYAERQAAFLQEANELRSGKMSGIQTHKRQVAAVEKSMNTEQQKLDEAMGEYEKAMEEFSQAKEKYEATMERKKRLEEEFEKLNAEETKENQSILEKLRSLVSLNEDLKKQEQDFKSHCKEEMVQLQENISKLNLDESSETTEELERMKLINEQAEKDKEKFQKIRLLLAKRNREIASLQWKLDDVPSRAELSQYQRRFIELYNQVGSTHKETKQFYTLYNTLDDTKLYLEKEVNLLNSIHDSFEQASTSSQNNKDEFLQQMENIVKGVSQNKEKVERKKLEEKLKRDRLNDQHIDLVEVERTYYKTIKEFKEECRKSEIIQAKLRALGHGQ